MAFVDKKNRLFTMGQNRDGKTGLGKTITAKQLKNIPAIEENSSDEEKMEIDPISR